MNFHKLRKLKDHSGKQPISKAAGILTIRHIYHEIFFFQIMPIDKGLVILNSCFVCFVRNVGTSSDTNTKSKPGRRRRVRHTNTKKQKVKISIIINNHRLP